MRIFSWLNILVKDEDKDVQWKDLAKQKTKHVKYALPNSESFPWGY